MREPHADGSPCTPIGLCLSCLVGHHEDCLDEVMIIGCACSTCDALSSLL